MIRRAIAALLLAAACFAQHAEHPDRHVEHPAPQETNPAGDFLLRQASGTSFNPQSWPMPMYMTRAGAWNLMFMGQAFAVQNWQTGPRGRDKLFSVNWGMLSAERRAGRGSFMLQFMPSLEPLTITGRRYPQLFQTGETAFGLPLVDAQHPHNFFMGLGVHYARPLSGNTMLQLYAAPAGDPALGPVAYPHRAAAMEIPQAPLSHHTQDSTHIAWQTVTMGLTYKTVRIEASGFHGEEPDERRWRLGYGPIDSWSTRFSFFPGANWAGQVSVGYLTNPEALEPGDIIRSTASLQYTRPLGDGRHWSTGFVFGRNTRAGEEAHGENTNAFLFETKAPATRNNIITARFELVEKDELFADRPDINHDLAHRAFRIGAYTAGYTRDFGPIRNAQTGAGMNFTFYSFPDALRPFYGKRPVALYFYLRVRLRAEAPHVH